MKDNKKGDIYIADLNPVKGHEQGGLRPVIIVQNNKANMTLNTVMIAPITSNTKYKNRPMTVLLNKNEGNLDNDSVVLCFQIRTLDNSRLERKIGSISSERLLELNKSIANAFDI